MEVTIEINGQTKSLSEKFESWISEQIRNRRQDGESITLIVRIGGDLDLIFVCKDSPSTGGSSGRQYTPRQQELINLWLEKGLNSCPVNPGNVISFLKELERRIS